MFHGAYEINREYALDTHVLLRRNIDHQVRIESR